MPGATKETWESSVHSCTNISATAKRWPSVRGGKMECKLDLGTKSSRTKGQPRGSSRVQRKLYNEGPTPIAPAMVAATKSSSEVSTDEPCCRINISRNRFGFSEPGKTMSTSSDSENTIESALADGRDFRWQPKSFEPCKKMTNTSAADWQSSEILKHSSSLHLSEEV